MGIIGGAIIKSQMSRVELVGFEVEVVSSLGHVDCFGHQQLVQIYYYLQVYLTCTKS